MPKFGEVHWIAGCPDSVRSSPQRGSSAPSSPCWPASSAGVSRGTALRERGGRIDKAMGAARARWHLRPPAARHERTDLSDLNGPDALASLLGSVNEIDTVLSDINEMFTDLANVFVDPTASER